MFSKRLALIVLALGCAQSHAEGGAALFGGAAIAASISPMVVAGIQAGADKEIAGIQSALTAYQVDRYSLSSEYQALLASQTAIAMAGIQYAVNGFNQMMTTDRLNMQLEAQQRANLLQRTLERERLQNQYSLLDRQLDLQEKALDQQFALTKRQASGELFDVRNSGASLAVRSYGITKVGNKDTTQANQRLLSSISYGAKRNAPKPKAILKPIVSTAQRLTTGSRVPTTYGLVTRRGIAAPSSGAPGVLRRHHARGAAGAAAAQTHHHQSTAEESSVVRVGR